MMKWSFFSIVQISFVLSITSLNAQELPRYDVASYCTEVAEVVGGSEQIRATCFNQEQIAYDRLKSRWNNVPDKTQSYCDQVARTVGASYQIFDTCVDQELQAASAAQDFRY